MKSQPGLTFTPATLFAGAAAGTSISAVSAATAAAIPFATARDNKYAPPALGASGGVGGPRRRRPRLPLASIHAAARLGGGGAGDHRARRGHRPDRRARDALRRRRL